MSWWSNSIRLTESLLLLILVLGSLRAETNALVLPPTDTRFIVDDEAFEKDSKKQTEQLATERKLINYTYLAEHVPLQRETLTLAPEATKALTTSELAERLTRSTVAIGMRYQEPHSKKWHYEIAATAFAVAPEILCTSLHVMTIDPSMMSEAQAVAVTAEGKVVPITEIVAASNRGDTALVRAPGLSLPTLPIRPGVKVGETVWCMSHPDGFTFMFTSGEVARVSRARYDKESVPGLNVEVTAEYCPGSSGGAVTDAAGNVVAQVSSINQYSESGPRDGKSVGGIVSARTCTAAEEMLELTKPGENEAVPLPSPTPKKKRRAPKAG